MSISGEAKVNAPPGDFPAKIGIFSADCYTPVCVKQMELGALKLTEDDCYK